MSLSIVGCSDVKRTDNMAIIYSTGFDIPMLLSTSVFLDAVDGIEVERSQGAVSVDPGHRVLRIGYISCPLPILVFTCLSDIGAVEIETTLKPNVGYELVRDPNVRIKEINAVN